MRSQFTALLFAVATMVAPVSAQDDTLMEYWVVMQTKGYDLGYQHTRTARVHRDNRELYETTSKMRMSMNRLGSELNITMQTSALETTEGKLVRMAFVMDQSSQKTEAEVFFESGVARIVTKLMGRERERTVSYPEEMLGPWGLVELARRHGSEPGSSFEATTFAIDQQKVTDVYTEIIGPEEVEMLDGSKRTLTKVVTELDVVPVPTNIWVDAEIVPHRSLINVAGLALESFSTTKERALASLDSDGPAPDVFTDTMLVARTFIPFPRELDGAVVEVQPRSDAEVDIISSAKQHVRAREDGSFEVVLQRRVPAADHGATRPLRDVPADIAGAIAPSTMIQCDEAEIIEIAERVVGDEPDAWKAAQKLEDWVQRNLTEKGFDVGFASALEVCRDRKGDCSEHAVFLAALCRAAGIPCRVSMGVLYLGGIWGGHAWNEVWIDGEWYALDATIGKGSADPLRLSFASMDMQDGDDGFAALMKNLGKVDVRVREFTHNGRTFAVEDGAVRIEGDRYVNELWGLSCTKPEGFEFDVQTPTARISFELLEIEGAGDDNRKIEINALDLEPHFDWDAQVTRFGGEAADVDEITVDGRPGRLIHRPRKSKENSLTMVRTEEALFLFTYGGPQDDAGLAVFREFLGSVDFDVSRN